MDFLQPFVQRVFTELLTLVTIEGADGIRRNLASPYHLRNKPELDAKIQKFFGNSFPEQLLEIGKLIDEASAHILKETKVALKEELLRNAYENTIEEKLRAAQSTYNKFLKDVCQTTWDEFCKSANLMTEMNDLFAWVTTNTQSRLNLLDELSLICEKDVQKFQKWQQHISLTFCRAYFLRTAFHYCNFFPYKGYTTKDAENEVGAAVWNTKLPDYVKSEMDEMVVNSQKVAKLLRKKNAELKVNFLLRRCGNDGHDQHCGAGNDQQCSELGSKIYKNLHGNRNMDNSQLANLIAKYLRKDYPYFFWSVVVMEDYRLAEFQLNHEHHSSIWLQRFGSRRSGPMQSLDRENFIMSKGLGTYGYFLCYRVRQWSEKAALVFWADPDVVQSPGMDQLYQQLSKKWKEDQGIRTTAKNAGAGSVYRVTGDLREMGMNYVFGVGLRIKEKEIGINLAKQQEWTFPLYLGDPTSGVLMWLDPSTLQFTAEWTLDEDKLENIVSKSGFGNSIKKGRRQNGEKIDFVAIKEIPLAFGDEKQALRDRQIACLESNLGFLKDYNHPGVVQYFGFQVIPPTSCTVAKYRVLMEFCAGVSITERVKSTVTINEIFDWGDQILKGLDYLHRRNYAHRLINGDHLLFEQSGQSNGKIKIISLGRVADILVQVSSHVPEVNQSSLPFKAPEMAHDNKRIGTLTDIWSFGCVLIQMVSGRPPELKPKTYVSSNQVMETLESPVVPEGFPSALMEVLQHCLAPEYDQRPTTSVILGKRIFEKTEEELQQMEWTCPSRPLP